MGLIPAAAVRRGLRRLSDERAVAFVAALWAARGAETSVDHERGVVEVRREGRTERLRVVTGRRAGVVGESDERLVLLRPAEAVRGLDADGRVIDADDLREVLLYGVPREAAAELCRRFLDRALVTDSPSANPRLPTRLPEQSASVVVGLVGLLLVVASVAGGPFLAGGTGEISVGAPLSLGGAGADGGGGATGETATATGGDVTDDDGTATDVDTSGMKMSSLPPGVDADGDIDEGVLANAHARAVTGQSYRWTLTHREFVDGRETAFRRETVYVASPTVYRTAVTGAGRLRHSALSIASVEAYADGSSRHERRVRDDGFDRSAPRPEPVRGIRNGEGRYADRAEQYLDWYLSVSESTIVDVVEREGTRYYWLSLGEDPYVGVENSSGSALVDEDGVVHEIRREYDVPDSDGVSAVVRFRYTDFGTTTVSPPAWHASAANASTGNTTATATPTVTDAPDASATDSLTPENETEAEAGNESESEARNESGSQQGVPATTVDPTTD
jgi:hypothetical protein